MDDDDLSRDGSPGLTERAGEALMALESEAVESAALIEEAFERAGKAIEGSLAAAARSGELAFDAMAQRILTALASLAIERFVDGTLAEAVGGVIRGLPVLGARAEGGPVLPGTAYLVGERGPELFRPSAAGVIEPASGGAVSVHFHFAAGADAAAFQRSQGQIATLAARAVARGRQRL